MRDLNLLLRQQSSSNLFAADDSANEENDSSGGSSVENVNNYENIKLELINVQMEESAALEHHKILYSNYNLLETIAEHILNHLECTILEIQSSNRLSHYLNLYCIQERCLDDNLSLNLKRLNTMPDISELEAIKNKLLMALNKEDYIRSLNSQFEEKYNNFKLALKNFKIILEILNVQTDCLGKLKRQFHEVLIDYKRCRCILDRELPFGIAERTKVLLNCLSLLGESYSGLDDRIRLLSEGFKKIVEAVKAPEYDLVKKEKVTSGSITD